MQEDPSACFCSAGQMVVHQGISFVESSSRQSFGSSSTMRSPNFPDSWSHQWFIELSPSSPACLCVKKTRNTDDYPSATFTFKIAGGNAMTLKWPEGNTADLYAEFPGGSYKSYLSNYTLMINVKISLADNYALTAKRRRIKFVDEFKGLFESQLGSDVNIVSSNGQLPAHWAVLAARSPFFSAMLKSDYKEKLANVIELDANYETTKKMLEFIYSDHVGISSVDDGQQLLRAGDVYLVDGLKTLAQNFLCSQVSRDNALDLLILSHLHGANCLKRRALDFIAKDSKSVTQHEKFSELLKYSDLVAELLSHACDKMST